jgi:hypothetical protein
MNKRMQKRDLLRVIAKDTGFYPAMFFNDNPYSRMQGDYFLEQCNAACAWLNNVNRTKNINPLACGSLLKSRAGAYAGHYISAFALAIAARHMGFKVLREEDEFYLNISKRNIPNCVDGAFPPGSTQYLRKCDANIYGVAVSHRHQTNELPNWYKREW